MPEPETPDTQAADDTPDSWRALVTEYPGKLLAEFLGRAEVRSACISGAKDWGCPAYVALPAYGALVLAAKLLANQGSESALSFIEKWIVRFPLARRMLTFLSRTHADLADKDAVRRHLIDALGAGTQAGGIEVDYGLSLELATHLAHDQQLKALAADIDDLHRAFPELSADALRVVLQEDRQPVLGWIEQSGESNSGAARIRYNSGLFGFFGRDEQIRTLREFCHEVEAPWERFSWTLITGGGGMGKTRLAYEFTRNYLRKTWKAGPLDGAEAEIFDPARFRPVQPTLLVIDYPARRPEFVRTLLAAFKRQSQLDPAMGGYAFPVRVLLLERDTQGNWFRDMLPECGDSDGVKSVYWQPAWAGDGLGWELPLLHPDALLETMFDRLHQAGLTDLPEPKQLFEAALKVDSYPGMLDGQRRLLPRPLFAAAAAEALVAARADGKAWATIVAALDRADVLDGLIRRDRANIWSKIGKGRNPDALALHENLLLLATFGLGLNQDARARAIAMVGDLLPDPGRKSPFAIDHDLLHAMSGGDAKDINPLEPDIVGEYFVLTRLQQLDQNESMKLRSASLAVNGFDAHVFILRCLRDFPELMARIDFLAPDGECADAALTFAMAAVDLAGQLGKAQDWHGLDAMMLSVASLHDRWPVHQEIALWRARAAVNVTKYAGTPAAQDGDWTRVEAMLACIQQLCEAWPDHQDIALEQGKAAVNVTSHAGAAAVNDGDWTRVEAMLTLHQQLCEVWPGHPEIAYEHAKSAFNVTSHAGTVAVQNGDWTRVEAMLAYLQQLREAWPDHQEIALEQAEAAVNVTYFAGTVAVQDGNWTRVEAMLACLLQLRKAWPDHQEIALQQANAAFNVTTDAGTAAVQNGDWTRVEAMEAIAASLLKEEQWSEAVHLMANNVFILSNCFKARGEALVPGASLDQALMSAHWLLSQLDLDDAGRCARAAFQLIRAAHQRFPDHSGAAALYREIEDSGFNWSQLPPLD